MKYLLPAGLAAALLLALPAWAQTEPTNETPAQNQKMSQQYQSMVSGNAGFRDQRMHKECDPITAPDLKQQCMSSFGATASGGSMGNMGSKSSKSTTKR